jgi:hypothetical protein
MPKKNCLIVCTVLLAACGGQTLVPAATPTTITPRQGLGGIRGMIQDAQSIWTEKIIRAYAARFYAASPGNGFYLLEPALDASIALDEDGFFQLNNLNPGSYVIVIGPEAENAIVVRDSNQPRVIQVPANQVIDLGTIELEISPPPEKPYP